MIKVTAMHLYAQHLQLYRKIGFTGKSVGNHIYPNRYLTTENVAPIAFSYTRIDMNIYLLCSFLPLYLSKICEGSDQLTTRGSLPSKLLYEYTVSL